MDFALNDQRSMLADTLNRSFADRHPIETRNASAFGEDGYSKPALAALVELGVLHSFVDEAAGGLGGSAFDAAVVFEAVGRALAVEPLLASLVVLRLLARSGADPALVDAILSGETLVAFAHEEADAAYGVSDLATRAEPAAGGDWRLTGRKVAVPFAGQAGLIFATAATEQGTALFRLDPGVAGADYGLVDGGRAADLILDRTPASLVLPAADEALADALAMAVCALAFEAVGIMQVLRDDTLDYLRTRVQFGQPIGKFQALQHRMATVALDIEQARSAAINLAAAIDAGDGPARERAGSAAKFTIGRAGALVAEEAIQLHGGIGMTWELRLPHYAKRLTMIDHQYGDHNLHLERFAALGEAA